MTGTALEALVDPRFGPVSLVRRRAARPGEPAGFAAYSAEVADTRAFAPWRADPYAFGASLTDPRAARLAAIGEAVERYCGNAVPAELPTASYRELAARGTTAVDPADLVLYAPEQYSARGFPFRPFDHDLRVRWAWGWELATGEPTLVPASLVWFNYHRGRYANEPPTNFMITAGVAAGPDRRSAAHAALAEVIERDAVTLWWQRGQAVTAFDPDPGDYPWALLAGRDGTVALEYQLFPVPSDVGVPVVAALVDDPVHGVVSLGSACHRLPATAAAKALAEAVQLRAFSLDLLDPGSQVWRGFRAGTRPAGLVAPLRHDRRYLDAGRPGFRDATDFAAHAQLYLDPRMRAHLARLLDPTRRAALPATSGTDLLDAVRAAGFRAVAVDLTTPDVAASGLHVVRVVVPGLYPSAPAAFPFLGGDRLYRLPGDAGRLDPACLVRAPLPGI